MFDLAPICLPMNMIQVLFNYNIYIYPVLGLVLIARTTIQQTPSVGHLQHTSASLTIGERASDGIREVWNQALNNFQSGLYFINLVYLFVHYDSV